MEQPKIDLSPPELQVKLPTELEQRWAIKETEANLRRARELGIFVDLQRIK